MVDLFSFFSDRPLGRMFDTIQSALDSGLKVLLLELDLVHHMLHAWWEPSLWQQGSGCECLRALLSALCLVLIAASGVSLSPVLPLILAGPVHLRSEQGVSPQLTSSSLAGRRTESGKVRSFSVCGVSLPSPWTPAGCTSCTWGSFPQLPVSPQE